MRTDGGLPAAGLAGHEADAAQVEQVLEPDLQLLGGGEEILGGEVLCEGVTGEAEVLAVHVTPPQGHLGAERRADGRHGGRAAGEEAWQKADGSGQRRVHEPHAAACPAQRAGQLDLRP